jgi:P pilus assembly chaperone PapD
MRLRDSGAHAITAGGTSARNSTAFNAQTQVISVYATTPVYLNFGDNTVTASNTDHYYPAGVYYDFAIGSTRTGHNTHLAVLSASGTGTVYVSEKE